MFRIIRGLVNFASVIIELLLTCRFILKFLTANSATPFVAWIYGITAPLVAPFAKILPNWKYSGYVIDFATLAALIVCAIVAYLILMILPYSGREPDL
jgi:uncharacterized protein YggT (Ycf19 family)